MSCTNRICECTEGDCPVNDYHERRRKKGKTKKGCENAPQVKVCTPDGKGIFVVCRVCSRTHVKKGWRILEDR